MITLDRIDSSTSSVAVKVDYDTIDITYPTTTKEVYTFTLAAASVRTITVDYTDATKESILKVTHS